MSSTRRPRRPAWAAHIMPAAPAPITMTSYVAGRGAVKTRSASSCAALVDASRTRSRLEEFAHLVKPVLRPRVVRARILRVDRLKLAQQILLPRGQLHRCLDRDMTEQVAVTAAAHALDAFSPQPENLTCLGFRRNLDLGMAVQRRNFDFAAHRRGREADRHFAVKIVVLALEYRMLLQIHDDIQVAMRAAVESCLAFARETDTVVVIDAGRDLDRYT